MRAFPLKSPLMANRWKRTDICGDLRPSDEGREVTVMGWVQSGRDHGGVIFIDIRDHGGIVQAVFDPSRGGPHAVADAFRSEWVVAVRGRVVRREPAMVNPSMPTGEIEIVATDAEVFNKCPELPFPVEDNVEADEPIRMKYRFLDLRRPEMRDSLLLRHRIVSAARGYLESAGFAEIETPLLTKATPEGARDFVVPCRQAGGFYALPQSPQLLKQMLMASGFDRYYQVARCFRDEDLRADRQPEFSQIDLEMAFADEGDVKGAVEELVRRCFAEGGINASPPFERISYADAMERYGCDHPDMRFGLELRGVSEVFAGSEFKVFSSALQKGGIIKALTLGGEGEGISRRDIDEMTEEAVSLGAGGLAWIRLAEGKWQSPIAKFLSDGEKAALLEKTGLAGAPGGLIFFGAGDAATVNAVLSAVRLSAARRLGLIKEGEYKFVWVENFPMFEREPGGRLKAVHHPFTAPAPQSADSFETDPENALSRAYDIVLNGVELGGGSVRIHNREMQEAVLRVVGMDEARAEEQFGFFLRALEFGAPPHAGVALGLDRMVMMAAGRGSIRDVTAFPKTQKGACPLTGAPSGVSSEQMAELGLRKV